MLSQIACGTTVAALPHLALAHAGVGETNGFVSGLMHPSSGLDHLLAMVATGAFAARLGGRATWLVPGSFVLLMIFGGALGLGGIPLPHVEIGIAASVVVLGSLVAMRPSVPIAIAVALVSLFAIFHGHAHGMEAPTGTSIVGYGAGFMLASILLHVTGMGVAIVAARAESTRSLAWMRQLSGAGVALAGIAMLARAL